MLLGVSNQKYQLPLYNLDIDTSTINGVDLFQLFIARVGRPPLVNEVVTFTVKPGVTVIGPTPQVAAIEAGLGWTEINVINIINRGNIFGRGGKGGRSAYHYKYIPGATAQSSEVSSANTRPAVVGGTGGTAVNSSVAPCFIENYGYIAGGGGGGGGLGIYRGNSLRSIGGGGTGGGAPFGKRSPNESTYSMYLEDNEFLAKKYTTWKEDWAAPAATNTWDSRVLRQHRNSAGFASAFGGIIPIDSSYHTNSDSESRVVFLELDKKSADFYEPFKVYLAFGDNSREYVTGHPNDGLLHHPVVTNMSTDGSFDKGGLGGAGLIADGWWSEANHGQSYPLDIINNPNDPRHPKNTTYGGSGGAVGEPGTPGTNKLYYASSSTTVWTFTDRNQCVWQTPNAAGGQAGLIKTGKVTISNTSTGVTKGR